MTLQIDWASLMAAYNASMDEEIDNLGVSCELVLPPAKTDCPNCELNPIAKVSASIYKVGGPIPFTNGQLCPYCVGAGWLVSEATQNIIALVTFDKKPSWLDINDPAWKVGKGIAQMQGYLSDLPAVQRANYIRVNAAQNGVARQEYVRLGEATIEGLGQNRYFSQWLERKP